MDKQYYIKGNYFYCKACNSRMDFPEYGNCICDLCSPLNKEGFAVIIEISIEDQNKLQNKEGEWIAFENDVKKYSENDLNRILNNRLSKIQDIFTKEEWMLIFESILYRFGADTQLNGLMHRILTMIKLKTDKNEKTK